MAGSGERSWLRRAARGAAILWTLVVLVSHSDTGVPFPLWFALVIAAIVLIVWWLIGATIASAAAWKDGASARTALGPWLATPALMLAAAFLVSSNLPLRTRLFFSGPALAQSGGWFSTLPEGYTQRSRPWVGLFRIREFAQFGDELRFLTSDCGLVDTCGLVFSPSGPPRNRGEDSFVHLYGPWWHWHQSW